MIYGKLAIIIGHSEGAQGAMALPPLGQSEYEYNTGLADLIASHSEQYNLDCRIFNRNIGLLTAYKNVNAWVVGQRACAIELHFNAAEAASARGSETLYTGEVAESPRLAETVQKYMCIALQRQPGQNRGTKLLGANDRGHYNLTLAKCASVIVEPFFGSNPDECQLALQYKSSYASSLAFAAQFYLLYRWPAPQKQG